MWSRANGTQVREVGTAEASRNRRSKGGMIGARCSDLGCNIGGSWALHSQIVSKVANHSF